VLLCGKLGKGRMREVLPFFALNFARGGGGRGGMTRRKKKKKNTKGSLILSQCLATVLRKKKKRRRLSAKYATLFNGASKGFL